MLFVADIGNTNIVIGLYEKDNLVLKSRIVSEPLRTVDEYYLLLERILSLHNLKPDIIDSGAVSSVVPKCDKVFFELLQSLGVKEPFFINSKVKLNIALDVENPEELGADRIVNAVAAYQLYKQDLIIIDFGTATTVDYVSKDGVYKGGLILPGYNLMKESLHRKTAKLPDVSFGKTISVLGRNTVENIQNGLFHLKIGGLERIVRLIKEEYSLNEVKIIATGGLACFFSSSLTENTLVEPDLTLKGIKLVYSLNIT